MRASSFWHRAAAMAAALLLLSLAVGCEMPTYTLYDPGEPSRALTEFFDAVNSGEEDAVNGLLYSGSWDTQTETPLSPADAELEKALAASRSFAVTDEEYDPDDSRKVCLTVSLTTLDIGLFEKKLTEDVESEIKQRIFDGEEFSEPSDIEGIIETHKLELLKEPERFYSTVTCKINLVCGRGKWQVVLTDELYDILLGRR